MPALSDLFNITPGAISTAPQRMRNLPPAPVKPEWDIRSGLPEPGLPIMDNGLTNLRDIVENGIRRGVIDPGSAARGNFTVEAAVRLADQERRAAEKAAASPDVFKEYPDTGYKWVQLNRPGQFNAESDAMRNSVRGYEPTYLGGSEYYGEGGLSAIESGDTKVFSLRDPNGNSKLTVEVIQAPHYGPIITQIKGRANSRPKPEYRDMIEDFRRSFEQ